MRNIKLVADSFCMHHLTGPFHPESPARFHAIDLKLAEAGLKEGCLKARKATLSEIKMCHDTSYIELVEKEAAACQKTGIIDGRISLSTGDVQICPASFNAALLAVGAALNGVDELVAKDADAVFSYLRPPGHHAGQNYGMGFCLFNQAAIAARYAQQKYGLKKIAIVDWDVHHGNGTYDIFKEDPSVFYFSTHQEGLYPGTGKKEEIGCGLAKGTKLNCPIKSGPFARIEVIEAFKEDLMFSMNHFQPDLLIISAGFDAHYKDPLGGLNLYEEDFATLTKHVLNVADKLTNGKVLSLLEGGYNIQYLALSVLAHVTALKNYPKQFI